MQLASVRMLPWAKANLNPTAQALIISTGFQSFLSASIVILIKSFFLYALYIEGNFIFYFFIIIAVAGMAYFIVADKTILATARRNSFHQGSNNEA